MGSRLLAAAAKGADDYLHVYDRVLSQTGAPVLLHWLGAAFDPAMRDYWGANDLDAATETVLQVMNLHPGKVSGIKVSLLDADREIEMRRRLPAGVRMFTGDDFNYPELIKGDEQGHSDALLGVLAVIAAPAAAALHALDNGDLDTYDRVLAPTVPLARHLFAAPTYHYKTGIVFLNWLAGHQDHFTMVGGAQAGRSPRHLDALYRLAGEAGVLPDADLAEYRVRAWRITTGLDR